MLFQHQTTPLGGHSKNDVIYLNFRGITQVIRWFCQFSRAEVIALEYWQIVSDQAKWLSRENKPVSA